MMKEQAEQLASYLLSGDENGALEYIDTLAMHNEKVFLYETIMKQAMYHVGALWEENEITVADEHLATAICDFVLSQMEDRTLNQHAKVNKKILLYGVENEEHYLGLKMVADIFREANWRVRYLGPNLPIRHVIAFVDLWKPDVVGMSIAMSRLLPTLTSSVKSLMNTVTRPKIVVGGRVSDQFHIPLDQQNQVIVMKSLYDVQKWIHKNCKEEKRIDISN